MTQKPGLLALALLCAVAAPALAFELQGHRGARGLEPENTLPAFERAIALGVDVLELDTGVTSDGIVVVSHERRLSPDLARGPDGQWVEAPGPLLRDITLLRLRRFDLGRIRPDSRAAKRFPEQRSYDGISMPSLNEVLALGLQPGRRALRFNIETKLAPDAPDETLRPEAFAQALIDTLQQSGIAPARVTVQSFDWRTLAVVNSIAPEIATVCLTAERDWLNNVQKGRAGPSPWTAGLDIDEHGGSVPRLVTAAGCSVWSPYHRDLTPETLAEAHGLGLKVVVWTVNDPADLRTLRDMGVDGIITDYPDRANEALGRE